VVEPALPPELALLVPPLVPALPPLPELVMEPALPPELALVVPPLAPALPPLPELVAPPLAAARPPLLALVAEAAPPVPPVPGLLPSGLEFVLLQEHSQPAAPAIKIARPGNLCIPTPQGFGESYSTSGGRRRQPFSCAIARKWFTPCTTQSPGQNVASHGSATSGAAYDFPRLSSDLGEMLTVETCAAC
jgi:hypothetical protein